MSILVGLNVVVGRICGMSFMFCLGLDLLWLEILVFKWGVGIRYW